MKTSCRSRTTILREYVLIYDPLDGSGNIDANITIGTIFSVYARVSKSGMGTLEDVLQPGFKQVAAGYLLFGSSMMFVYCTGEGVHGFTLDPSVGEFLLSHEASASRRGGTIYSVNEGNAGRWEASMQRYIRYLKEEEKESGRPIPCDTSDRLWRTSTGRCSMADLLLPGRCAESERKIRLMYENNPLAFLVEHAGGAGIRRQAPHPGYQADVASSTRPSFHREQEEVRLAEEFWQGPGIKRKPRSGEPGRVLSAERAILPHLNWQSSPWPSPPLRWTGTC